jgi:hypothetical protein
VTTVVRIKNTAETPRSIRPYTERGELVTLEPGSIVSIDLKKCGFEVKTNPRQYFTRLGFVYDPSPEPAVKTAEPLAVMTGEKITAPEKSAELPEPAADPAPAEKPPIKTRIGTAKGDIKHFHPGNRMWHIVRAVNERLIGKTVFNAADKAYFKVSSLDGDLLVGIPMSEEEALKLTGVAP